MEGGDEFCSSERAAKYSDHGEELVVMYTSVMSNEMVTLF
jgi:hypothetical protein